MNSLWPNEAAQRWNNTKRFSLTKTGLHSCNLPQTRLHHYISIAGCFWPQTGEGEQLSISSLTFCLHQPLSRSLSFSLLHCWNNHQLPLSLLSFPQSLSIFQVHPGEWFPLVACGPPNPLLCQSTQLWETDSSMCKSIIIFRQCNPIPEDILLRTNNVLFLLRTFWHIQHRNAAISGSRQEKINLCRYLNPLLWPGCHRG